MGEARAVAEAKAKEKRRAKSTKKRDAMLRHLDELKGSNKQFRDKESKMMKRVSQLETSTVDSGIGSRLSLNGHDRGASKECDSSAEEEEEEEYIQVVPRKNKEIKKRSARHGSSGAKSE